jgi:uncharacterized protein (TIGR00661 family)
VKVLFGVQGTGNGHISRANAISQELARYDDVFVDWILSGRPPNDLFQVRGKQSFKRGLTFVTRQGEVRYLATVKSNNVLTFARDVFTLELDHYDCLVSDYEPILSWAAKLRGKPVIGIGHQYAFNYQIPMQGDNRFNRALLRHFAPVDIGLGLHWHHFDQPILPPICDVPDGVLGHRSDKVVVYLPFEDQQEVLNQLRHISDHEFFVYGPDLSDADLGHVHTRALSREGFKKDLVSSSAVVTNAGFELISECLSLGIRLLAKPLNKQVEQLSNGAALSQLGYATVVDSITTAICKDWLRNSEAVLVTYPSVHEKLAMWLAQGRTQTVQSLSEELWARVEVHRGSALQKQIA